MTIKPFVPWVATIILSLPHLSCSECKCALRTDGQPCGDALDAYYVCISELDCAELVKGEPPSGCQAETAAVMAACHGYGGPDTDASDSATDTVSDSDSSTG